MYPLTVFSESFVVLLLHVLLIIHIANNPYQFLSQKYAALLEKEKVGAAELPYVGEDKLRALGVPLGPRMRILKEAGIHQDLHHMSRDDQHNTTTTLAIV